MAQLITSADLALILGETIPQDRFDAVYTAALRAVRTGYEGDPEAATGRTLDVVTSVLTGVIVRILTNPKGARTLGLGSGNVTFGGTDADIPHAFALTDEERDDLANAVLKTRTGAFTIRAGASTYTTTKSKPVYGPRPPLGPVT